MLSSRFSCCHTMFMYRYIINFLMKDFFLIIKKNHVFRCQSIKLGYFCLWIYYEWRICTDVELVWYDNVKCIPTFLFKTQILFLCICVTTFCNFSCSVCKNKKKPCGFLPIIKTHMFIIYCYLWALYLLLYLWYMILFDYGRCSNWVGG